LLFGVAGERVVVQPASEYVKVFVIVAGVAASAGEPG